MTKVEKTSEFTEFVYLKNNPTGLVNDLNAEYKYRSNVLHNNRCKLRNTLSSKAYYIICDLFHLMKSNKHDMIAAITFEIYRELFDFSRRDYYSAIKELINRGIIVKVNNKNSDKRYYVNPCIVCKLTKDQRNEFALVHFEYFRSLE